MIALLAWLLVAPILVLADGWLLELVPFRIDLTAATALAFALTTRSRPLPALILALALARAVMTGGGLAAQYLALALPVALVRPLRAIFDERSPIVQSVVAPVMALSIPRLLETFARLSGEPVDPLPIEVWTLLSAVICVPLAAALLGRIPPLSSFSTRVRRRARGES